MALHTVWTCDRCKKSVDVIGNTGLPSNWVRTTDGVDGTLKECFCENCVTEWLIGFGGSKE